MRMLRRFAQLGAGSMEAERSDSSSRRQQRRAAAAAATVSALPLGVFRICWSALMVYSMLSTVYGSSELQAKFGSTSLNFRFWWADSCVLLRPTASQAASLCLAAALAASAVSLGLPQPLHRLASVVLLALYATLQLWEKSRYNNHYYLDCLLAGLFAATDAHAALSVSGALAQPPVPRARIPAWQLWAFRLQLIQVYVYGALAKLSSEDWVYWAQPMTGWLQLPGKWTPLQCLAAVFYPDQADQAAILGAIFSVGGVLFDLCIIVPLLLSTNECNPSAKSRSRWRGVSWLCTLFFHGTNATIFNIGTFPYMMVAANALFLMDTTGGGVHQEHNIHQEHCYNDVVDNESAEDEDERKAEGAEEIPEETPEEEETRTGRCLDCCGGGGLGVAGSVIAVVWCMMQLMIPLRHRMYEGPVVWTGEGYHCSWMMKLADNKAMLRILLDAEPPGDQPLIAPVYSTVRLSPGQVGPALLDPDSVEQLVSHVQDLATVQGILPRGSGQRGGKSTRRSVEAPVASVEVWRALNFRPYQRWSNPAVEIPPPPESQQCTGAGGGGSHSWLIRHPLTLSPQDTELVRQRLQSLRSTLISSNGGNNVPMVVLPMMEAAARGYGPWTAILPAALATNCLNVSLSSLLGSVLVRIGGRQQQHELQPGESMPVPAAVAHHVSPGVNLTEREGHSSRTEIVVWAYSATGCTDGDFHRALQLVSAQGFGV